MLMQVLRVLLLLVLATLLVGFGICGAYGVVVGLSIGLHDGTVFMAYGAIGLLFAWGCWKGIAALRRARRAPDA